MTIHDLVLQHAPRQLMAARIASVCERPDVECFYFGCSGQRGSGHVLHVRRVPMSTDLYALERTVGAAFGGIDGALCWNSRPGSYSTERDETEGRALLTRRGGWTAIAFWDRSGDPRSASNSAFIVRGELTFDQVVRVARQRWPEVWARFTFPVVEVDRAGKEVRR